MDNYIRESGGLLQIPHGDLKKRIVQHQLFGLDYLQEHLFQFCRSVMRADAPRIKNFVFYDLVPSVLLFGPPNTGKTTLCYLLFDRLKKEVDNEINFYTIDVGKMLDPALGQSSRNLEQAFEELRKVCAKGSFAFLVLDELDSFCMSRSRVQEHDAIRRAMTTLMLELDKLHPSSTQKLILFGITNVDSLIDTAVVRRFSLKRLVDPELSIDDFFAYIKYLSKPIEYKPQEDELKQLYEVYRHRNFKPGDIKNVYKILFIDLICQDKNQPDREQFIKDRLLKLFKEEFSTEEHLAGTYGGFTNGR
ncbi:ATP-binding protein [Lyngbya sp. CCY1209]|uniref:ATP-binding protein n=1 Tax=Lyngbya sp. CCY1209 TaxID=2886103 RepID=UPI002D20DD7D|nr:ATP-binding protein [Lyngbya sp. CCY1209]MEB3885503.1 ATP-binding protein [Lyngbya sp. CCY1209]